MHLSNTASLLSCFPPFLHISSPASHLSCIHHVQHISCSISLLSLNPFFLAFPVSLQSRVPCTCLASNSFIFKLFISIFFCILLLLNFFSLCLQPLLPFRTKSLFCFAVRQFVRMSWPPQPPCLLYFEPLAPPLPPPPPCCFGCLDATISKFCFQQ